MADDSLLARSFTSNFTPTPADLADIQRLVRCGSPPSDPARIRAIISGAPADLERYVAEIEKVEQQNMQQELRRLTLEHKTLASLLSPVQRLPNELLAEIFDLCFPANLYCMGVSGSSVDEVSRLTRRHLQRLVQVCFRWYRVALNTPKLWSTIVIHFDLWGNASLDDTTLRNLLESSLERGKEHPLDIVRDIKAFQHAPSLTELTIGREFDDLPTLPWPQIKTVTYDSLSDDSPFHSALSLLRAAINLVTCTLCFHLEGYDPDNEPWGTHATSRTRELYIQWMTSTGNETTLGRFLDSLTLPCLDVFDIRPDDGGVFPPLWPTHDFLSLAGRSGFQSTLTYLVTAGRKRTSSECPKSAQVEHSDGVLNSTSLQHAYQAAEVLASRHEPHRWYRPRQLNWAGCAKVISEYTSPFKKDPLTTQSIHKAPERIMTPWEKERRVTGNRSEKIQNARP
ncbi:hypothetical protein R3P38DRAFT_2766894 [Favolaschia claudopus]|uniref:F-box domain-containing protein n=1 Tax=Favolaschia claudopus TaxID=2862362 RepID=A0AAW0CTV7_9AGAR